MELFDSLKIRGIELRNRIVVSPMMQYATPGGVAGPWHLVHLGSRAVGGAGLIIAEQTAVSAEGRSTLSDLGLWTDAQRDALRPIAAFVSEHGAVPGIQLGLAGRKGSVRKPWDQRIPMTAEEGAWQVLAPSALAHDDRAQLPRALTLAEIAGVIESFRAAAKRAAEAGFRYLELHAGHGYPLHQFLSPYSNRRDDAYGGDAARRWRLLYEVTEAVRTEWPKDYPLAVRLSAVDRVEGGNLLSDTIEGVRALAELGVDVIDVSSFGGVGAGPPDAGASRDYELAATFRRSTSMLTAAVGLIEEPEQADQIVRTGQADLVVLARAMLRDPYWAAHAAATLGKAVPHPISYARAWGGRHGKLATTR